MKFRDKLALLMGPERPFTWALRIGLTKGSMTSMWTRGARPQKKTLDKIVAGTGCSREWLEDDIGEPFPAGIPAAAPAAPQAVLAPPAEAVPRAQDGPPALGQVAPAAVPAGGTVDIAALANLVRTSQAAALPGTALGDIGEQAVELYNLLFSRKNGPVNVGALAAVLEASLEMYPDVDKAAARAVRFYQEALEECLITPDGVGDGGARSA